jgi:N-acetyltransferase 10
MRLLDVLADKSLDTTVSITAARGRGKSATLGVAAAGALAFGYTNVFATSPAPENLTTFFQFIVKAFDALKWQVGNIESVMKQITIID